ncbi:aminoglycoside phosphotransferase [Sphingobium indicum BiD32]|uniref:Aminoglycoside phosphotransferase n=1 Tax=Sphingobium indicum BiD32 TaxID=1301087 RepID=N1MNU0_9SPHN|nr:aminoglycoside phosphotransferase [Sphingobium indicum BiD32]
MLDDRDGLGPGFIMAMVEGETVPQKILRSDEFSSVRRVLAAQCGDILAQIHATPLDDLPILPRVTVLEKVTQLRRQYLALSRPLPVFELAFQWLIRRLPEEPDRPRLVHGDFRNGNLIIDATGIAAVLDWERAFIGDPMFDIGWLCVGSWRFGEIDKPIGGFGSIGQFAASYAGGGGEMNLERARFWEAYGILDWGVTTLELAAEAAETGALEAAAIGRRTTETEIDLLRLIRDDKERA